MKIGKPIWILLSAFLLVQNLFLASLIVFRDRFLPGTTIAGVDIGLMKISEARGAIEAKIDSFGDITISTKNQAWRYSYNELVGSVDIEKTLKELKAGQKNPSAVFYLRRNNNLKAVLREEKVSEILTTIYPYESAPLADPRLNDGKVVSGITGKRVSALDFEQRILDRVGQRKYKIEIGSSDLISPSTVYDASSFVLPDGDYTLSFEDKRWPIKNSDLLNWLSFSKPQASHLLSKPLDPRIEPEPASVKAAFTSAAAISYVTKIGDEIKIEPVDARLTISGGRVTVFSLARIGRMVDAHGTLFNLMNAVNNDEKTAKLMTKELTPIIREDNLERLGLKELVASGTSNFKGSPKNRRHNINVGASKFHGVLIKPDEVFSFNAYLGPVEKHTGYLPELVIVKDGTEPQYGGGLCQVSTTMFRAALNAGFPILERRIHSYPVKYYAPYGTDATIYLPRPDFKFKNDTGHYLLIQSRIENSKLFFEIYGTKPARTVKFSGNNDGGKVGNAEAVSSRIWDRGIRGNNSFNAEFWRFIYDANGALIRKDNFVSRYDSPDKYPKRAGETV